jgi:hypothetical protein
LFFNADFRGRSRTRERRDLLLHSSGVDRALGRGGSQWLTRKIEILSLLSCPSRPPLRWSRSMTSQPSCWRLRGSWLPQAWPLPASQLSPRKVPLTTPLTPSPRQPSGAKRWSRAC